MTAHKQLTLWILSLALFLFLGSRGWATEISAADYRSKIQDYLALLGQKEGKLQPEESYEFSQRFPPDLVVQDLAGDGYLIDREDFLRWIQGAEASQKGRDELVAYLQTLSNQIFWEAEGRFQKEGSWEECRTLLERIYESKEFSKLVNKRTPAWQKYLRELLATLGKWLDEHFKFLGGIKGKWIFFAVYLALLALGTVLIIRIVRLLGPVGWRWRQPRMTLPASTQWSSEKDWREWRDQAEQKAQQGAYREAIRFLFISVLVEGQQKGWWLFEPEATNREHLSRVEISSVRREPLQRLIESYELAWYGLRQPGQQEFQECKHLALRMEALA